MKIQDKIYLSILFLLVAISFLNVTVNRMVFDRKITSQVMLDEKLVLGIPIPSEKEIKKRATINVPEGSKRRSRIYTGTAFHVDGGIWLTARHVIDSCNAIYVSNFNGNKESSGKLISNFKLSGKCSTPIILLHIITARCITFSSSRIFPGQL